MSFYVIKMPDEYVQTLLDQEESTPGPILFASSFVSSVYFPESAIRRFYELPSESQAHACDILLRRRQVAVARSDKLCRRELYEAEAFTKLLSEGTVHTQDAAYRSRPSEIKLALDNVLQWAQQRGTLEIAITTEVLPIVFTLFPPATVVVDIRTNYLYQRIQGFLIQGQIEPFYEEFERLWRNAIAQTTAQDVLSLIKQSLNQWQSGGPVDLRNWPKMRKSDRY